MIIRHAEIKDLEIITLIETSSFPKTEASAKNELKERVELDGDLIWILEDKGEPCAFIQGFPSNSKDLSDDMFHNSSLRDKNGEWIMLLSVATLPSKRNNGYAGKLMNAVINDSKMQGRRGIVLTCKENLIPFYKKFGYVSEGKSESSHGGAVWYQMRLSLK